MSRKARKDLIGKFYHIMIQGLNKEYIFENSDDKEKYKRILKENIKEKNIDIIAYCIMGNHAHILVYTEDIKTMINVMQRVKTKYAMYYNKIRDRVGFVFRNRYNSQEIQNEGHLKNCIVYIHKNPVKSEIVKEESKYIFSSYNEYMEKTDLISENIIKIIFGMKSKEELKKEVYYLHMKNVEDNFIEISTNIDYIKILKEYKNERYSDKQIINRFKEKYKLSERKIAEIMNMTRYQIIKMLK